MSSNFVFFCKKISFIRELAKKADFPTEIKVSHFNDRPSLVEHITSHNVEFMVICDVEASTDLSVLLRGLEFTEANTKTKIVVISDDLKRTADAIDAFSHLNIKLLNITGDPSEIVKEINYHAFGLDSSSTFQRYLADKLLKDMDHRFFTIFVDACHDTLCQFAGESELTVRNPFLFTSSKLIEKIELRSRILIEDDIFKGAVFLSFPKETYLGLCEKVFGTEFTEINDEINDFILEISNILYGQSKRLLNSEGVFLDKVIPEFYTDTPESEEPIIVVSFMTNFGSVYMKFAPTLL